MKNEIVRKIENELLYFDGAMGTELQKRGLKTGELPERLSLTNPETITEIHRAYLEAGSDVISTNTFGANPIKFSEDELEEIINASVDCAQKATKATEETDGKKRYIALDIGPLGKILKPFGDLSFEDAYENFAKIIRTANDRTDLILIETMNDAYEVKAAVLAAKENSTLPVFVTCVFDGKQKLMTGADAKAIIALLEGLGVDAIGINCSLGPKKMNEVLKTFAKYSSTPLIICPNAGLPHTENGVTLYDVTPEDFALEMKNSVAIGAHGLGGCCGTNPIYIEKLIKATESMEPKPIEHKNHTMVSSYTHAVEFGETPVIIGERINPTGKKRVKQALKENDLAFILREGVYQAEAGAEILDVNCGLPELSEAKVMKEVVESLQGVLDTPLQIDTSDPVALENALRTYNGKAIINSVNGKRESMEAVFPIAKKYGGVIVALTLDEEGIPTTAEGRVEIAKRIIKTAESYGIDKKNIIVDTLTMSISTDKTAADVTISAIEKLTEMGIKTTLGVSNISFGLPHRDYVNSRFFAEALSRGLSSAIMNPHSEKMQKAIENRDNFAKSENLVKFAEDIIEEVLSLEDANVIPASNTTLTLKDAIVSGLSQESETLAQELLKIEKPLTVVNDYIVPALDTVGEGFEKGKVYLPRLLMSAEAAKAAFGKVKDKLASDNAQTEQKDKIVIATVKGDIHDIGKNIVKILLENYGYRVIDLGKDVPEEKILEVAKSENATLVALSALMTTTVPSMERTIKLIHKELPKCKVTVGGAVMSEEYSNMIEADFYSKDAMGCVRIAEKFFGK